ncbi:hypothetical protein [Burkholderia sp. HI2714]|uniref:hypothetical protein n=1 Tax=Burkholderia sp. HI2714 TaxID=2015359 RepID=UPI0015C5D87B|nr:hypothetical protein [Burkholderia sp. HI2714]
MRQITGFMEEYWRLRGLEIAVPSVGQLSERFATLTVSVQQRCERVAGRLANGEVSLTRTAADPPTRIAAARGRDHREPREPVE